MTTSTEPTPQNETDQPRTSLDTSAARNLATTTKTPPQMQEISSRWLLKALPWVQVNGGTFRVNRRLSHTVGNGRVEFVSVGSQVRVIPAELGELPALAGFEDADVLQRLADACQQQDFTAGEVVLRAGDAAEQVLLVAHGKLGERGPGPYDSEVDFGVLADGDFYGHRVLTESEPGAWEHTLTALTSGTVLILPRQAFQEIAESSAGLREHLATVEAATPVSRNSSGESAVELASGHVGEPRLPGTFVDYDPGPREYELSVAQTVLRVHSRVADLYNEPMNQVEEQLRLTVEALRERQESELVNNPEFGLLHNVDPRQRIHTRGGAPTPDDLDALITRRRKTKVLLAHPRAIAAFGRECSRRGVYPHEVALAGTRVRSWRGIPLLPCDKIPVTGVNTSSVIAMRTGQENEGVVGLHQPGIPDEYDTSLNVRFMRISEQAVISYLVSLYFSAAVLVPDALGVLENVEV